ncbi:hypothetical protein GYMLUDRAFT_913101 [Collybiopsis luxurians FD-317 M1]|nr:hypothetical protein GYMLUDRAFT_913101 [Collybiopsis luxurians FD-317 M1]
MSSANWELLCSNILTKKARQSSFILLTFEILLYGAYIVIFGLYIYLQLPQQEPKRIYQACLLLLFLLSTGAIVLSILNFEQLDFLCSDSGIAALKELANFDVVPEGIYAAASITADALLLHRCYVVWTSRKWVLVGPTFMVGANAGVAITSVVLLSITIINMSDDFEVMFNAGTDLFFVLLVVNLATNLILTGLIGGRLWWLSRIP